jgi:hypothetical protein
MFSFKIHSQALLYETTEPGELLVLKCTEWQRFPYQTPQYKHLWISGVIAPYFLTLSMR